MPGSVDGNVSRRTNTPVGSSTDGRNGENDSAGTQGRREWGWQKIPSGIRKLLAKRKHGAQEPPATLGRPGSFQVPVRHDPVAEANAQTQLANNGATDRSTLAGSPSGSGLVLPMPVAGVGNTQQPREWYIDLDPETYRRNLIRDAEILNFDRVIRDFHAIGRKITVADHIECLVKKNQIKRERARGIPTNPASVSATGGESTACPWDKLRDSTKKLDLEYIAGGEVEDNGSHIRCVARTQVLINNEKTNLHANKVVLTTPHSVANSSVTTEQHFVAAQAPKDDAVFNDLLLHAIVSGEGIFQIVSPRVQRACLNSNGRAEFESKARGALVPAWLRLGSLLTQTIGNQYKITGFEKPASAVHSAPQKCISGVLKVIDTKAQPPMEINIPITQVGLPFADAVLKAEEIQLANGYFESHVKRNTNTNPRRDNGPGPVIVSNAGVGRNATVMVCQAIKALIEVGQVNDETELKEALRRVILEGRQCRGPHFIHSREQYDQLLAYLLEVHKTKLAAS